MARYPRTRRVNQVLREVVADALERLTDESGVLLTVTDVTVEPDLRQATVWFSSLPEASRTLLEENRVALQEAVARQTVMKRTPRLRFDVDPGIQHGAAVEDILRRLHEKDHGGDPDGDPAPDGPDRR